LTKQTNDDSMKMDVGSYCMKIVDL